MAVSGDGQRRLPGSLSHDCRSCRLLTVCVPVRNEVNTLAAVLSAVERLPSIQVVVVDDGSTDGTLELAQSLPSANLVIRGSLTGRGRGAAVTAGLRRATAPLFVVQDGDLEYRPDDILSLVRCFTTAKDSGPLAIFGSRTSSVRKDRYFTDRGIAFLNAWVRLCGGVKTTDHATCYKLIPTRILRLLDIQATGFDWCGEVCVKLGRLAAYLGSDLEGSPLVEVPISYSPRTKAEGKKLRLWHGLPVARTIWRWRSWNPPGPRGEVAAEVVSAIFEVRTAIAALGQIDEGTD